MTGDAWTPASEMRPIATDADRAEALEDGLEICEEGHGAWDPRGWEGCPVCFDRDDPMAIRRRLREEAESREEEEEAHRE